MSRLPACEPWPRSKGYSDWRQGPPREGPEASLPSTSGRLPREVELTLVRGLIQERSRLQPPEDDWALVRMTGGSFLAGLTIWGFAAYGAWSLLG